MMTNYCENCGCKVFSGACTNCHEEIYIREQYIDLNMEIPKLIKDKAEQQEIEIERKRQIKESM